MSKGKQAQRHSRGGDAPAGYDYFVAFVVFY
jgi:hypothetical protein